MENGNSSEKVKSDYKLRGKEFDEVGVSKSHSLRLHTHGLPEEDYLKRAMTCDSGALHAGLAFDPFQSLFWPFEVLEISVWKP